METNKTDGGEPRVRWGEPVLSRSPEETWALAAALVREAGTPLLVALHGDLGSGKTCFVQGLAYALGHVRPVTSPTFTIVSELRGARPLCHIDLYRLGTPEEIQALGFEEYLQRGGVTAVEWAERAAGLLPPHTVSVTLEPGPRPDERWIVIERRRVRSTTC